MNLSFSNLSREHLKAIECYIAGDNPQKAKKHLSQIISKMEIFLSFPYIGKVNAVYNIESVREFVVMGYKVIYQIRKNDILILAVYKYINFDERQIK